MKMQFLTISYKLLKWKDNILFVHLVNLILLYSILSLWLYVFQFLPPTPPLFSTLLFLPPNPVLFYFYDHFLHYYCVYCTSYHLTTILFCIILSCSHRGISVTSTVLSFEYKLNQERFHLNLLDTPGHQVR